MKKLSILILFSLFLSTGFALSCIQMSGNDMIKCYSDEGSYTECVTEGASVAQEFAVSNELVKQAQTLDIMADCYEKLKDHNSCGQTYAEAASAYKNSGDNTGAANSYKSAGACYDNALATGEITEKKNLVAYRSCGDEFVKAARLESAADCYEKAEKYVECAYNSLKTAIAAKKGKTSKVATTTQSLKKAKDCAADGGLIGISSDIQSYYTDYVAWNPTQEFSSEVDIDALVLIIEHAIGREEAVCGNGKVEAGEECDGSAEPGTGYYCKDCGLIEQKANGEACTLDEECVCQTCVQGICCKEIKRENKEPCEFDEDCKSGYCENNENCADKPKEIGDACEENEECKSGKCEEGKCVENIKHYDEQTQQCFGTMFLLGGFIISGAALSLFLKKL